MPTPIAAATLVQSFVTSRLDYCSSLFAGLPATRLSCLDRAQRSAARLIGRPQVVDFDQTRFEVVDDSYSEGRIFKIRNLVNKILRPLSNRETKI